MWEISSSLTLQKYITNHFNGILRFMELLIFLSSSLELFFFLIFFIFSHWNSYWCLKNKISLIGYFSLSLANTQNFIFLTKATLLIESFLELLKCNWGKCFRLALGYYIWLIISIISAYLDGNFLFFLENGWVSVYYLSLRYFQPPGTWIQCALESRELLALCLKKIKAPLSKVRQIATFL